MYCSWDNCICFRGGILLSFNYLKDFKPLFNLNLFALVTDAATNLLLPIGGLGFALFVGYKVPYLQLKNQLSSLPQYVFKMWLFLIKYIAPLGVLIILIEGVL